MTSPTELNELKAWLKILDDLETTRNRMAEKRQASKKDFDTMNRTISEAISMMEREEAEQCAMFRPCPICGRELTLDDLDLYDDEGDTLEELKSVMAPDGTFDRKALGELAENLDDCMTAVESVIIGCDCGFAFAAGDIDVRRPGWLKEFAEKANRRVGE